MSNILEPLQELIANPIVVKILVAIIGLIAIAFFFRLLQRSLPRYIKDADTRYRARKTIGLAGYILMIIFVASVFGDSLGQLAVIFGAIGAGIAFALQEVITSIAGWVAISLGQYYQPGDRILLGGVRGDVIDITVLRTTVMECGDWVEGDLYNGRIVRIANSFVFKEPVFNYSADFPFLWDELVIPLNYNSDRKLARELLNQAVCEVMGDYIEYALNEWKTMVRKYLIEDARVEPIISIAAKDSWMEYTVRYVVDYKERRGRKDMLFDLILDKIDATNGKVQLPTATLELVRTSQLKVRLDPAERSL
ncbi:MscS Mechanosensitive ion channel [Thalassoporum mexicanum PCC 7367]|uniref:mechanosensitive ion channel family protein n=1 Tax=Thalassoporum mexicanum TaxID=3457544 RepID=UPI00029FD4E1|nr:mechanosensitive ion channel domain-containing protein [Pseudanabaena sp. PCC 7367]AFY70203.1 MscS Mechanosensitive ion channel [Pseudanabaena sp. PCC 7367]